MESGDLSSRSKGELIDVMVPHLGLTVTEVKIVRWLKQVGQPTTPGEVIAEVETDKAVTDIESPVKGIMATICAQEDQIVPVGQKIAVIKKD